MSTTTHIQGTSRRRGRTQLAVRAGLALATAAGVAAGIGGLGMHAADAAGTHPFGTTSFIQSQDFSGFKENVGELNQQTTNLYGTDSVTACTGHQALDLITGNKNLTSMESTWTNSDGEGNGYITEVVAEAKTPAAAKRAAKKVLRAAKQCQQEPKGHWHYGQVYHGPLRNNDDVWMDTYNGKGKNTGGVSIMLQGKRFGVIQVKQSAGATGTGDDAIKDVTYMAEKRLSK